MKRNINLGTFQQQKKMIDQVISNDSFIEQALLFSLFEPNCDWLSHNIDAMLSHSIMDNFKSTNNITKDDKRFFKKSEESTNDYQFLPTVEDIPV
jgi:hypothetical protein